MEPGVTGKEKRWQQNRYFGPGAFKPYKDQAKPSPRSTPMNSGVYHGGAKARSPYGPALEGEQHPINKGRRGGETSA